MPSGISSFFGLNTALRGLQASQVALDVTAHNIANADTAGYTRQAVELEQVVGLKVSAGARAGNGGALLGGGVDVTAYRRIRDAFADLQYRTQTSISSEADTTAQTLANVELVLNEPGDKGIATLLSRLWDAWQQVANQPEDTATKGALVVNAIALADGIRSLQAQLTAVKDNAAQELAAYTTAGGDILSNAAEIARLNAEIKRATAAGQQPNALLDQRDRLIDRLAELGHVTITELPNNSIQIAFGNVNPPLLVDDTTAWAPTPPDTSLYPTPAPGGIIGALQALSETGGTIDQYLTDLDAFVNQLVTDVNAAYGGDFFDPAGTTAATIAVDAAIAADPSTVMTTAVAGSPPGANDIALAVAALRGGAADRQYAGLILRIGSEARDANRRQDAATAVLESAKARRDSVSGVSIDEEMANMIRFQRAYQASARTLSTLDDMLDTLINRTGRVGL
ncbi:MAG: flagellar hook-associated protein FlgK [Solirubrobacteraceae bacterium]|nr:flagellar hook-associated protein FlgK [Solirubrobacteraceae bacterium]